MINILKIFESRKIALGNVKRHIPPTILKLYDCLRSCSELDYNYKEIGENTNGPAATLFIYNPYRRYEVWRFVTYMFVHVGVMHIMMNLIIQIFLGIALELVHHWWRVALVYLAGK